MRPLLAVWDRAIIGLASVIRKPNNSDVPNYTNLYLAHKWKCVIATMANVVEVFTHSFFVYYLHCKLLSRQLVGDLPHHAEASLAQDLSD